MVKAFAAALLVIASACLPACDAFGGLEEGLTAKKTYRPDGSVEKVIVTDKDNRKVYEAFYNPDGKLSRNPVDNWAAVRYFYDKDKLTKEVYFGEDGKAKETKKYNNSGDLIGKDYYGEEGIDEDEEYDTQVFPYGEVNMYP